MKRIQLNLNQEARSTVGIMSLVKKIIILTVIIAVVFNNPFLGSMKIAKAATSVTVSVNYAEETATITSGGSYSTKFYMSTDNQKTWEQIEAVNNAVKIDISSLLSSSAVTIYFKGNLDTEPLKVVLPAQDKSFKPVYKVLNGVGTIEFVSGLTVQCKKGQDGTWATVTSPVYTSIYETKGATLYFRTAPTTAIRAGKSVAVKVPKRPTAPSIRVDGSKLYVTGMKSGETQYRVGNSLTWLTYTSTSTTGTKYMELTSLLGGSITGNQCIPAGTIEFRTPGTDKKINSSIRAIEISQQPTIMATAATLTGSTLAINDSVLQYEYTTLGNAATIDLQTAKWTTVTSKRPVIVPKVNVNDYVLVRAKSYTDKTTKKLVLASNYLKLMVMGITTTTK